MTSLDASKPIRFDLPLGEIRAGDDGRAVLVPVTTLTELLRDGDAALALSLGRAFGRLIGGRVRREVEQGGRAVREAAVELVLAHFDNAWRAFGLGRLTLERWGRALVAVVDDAPFGEAGDKVLEAALSTALSEATSPGVTAVRLARGDGRARFLLTSDKAASQLQAWLGSGMSWADALVRLHGRPLHDGGAA